MQDFPFILLGIVAVTALLSGGIAAIARFLIKNDGLAIAIGGLALPALIIASTVYWLPTLEVDDAPPGSVIQGTIMMVAINAPFTFLTSYLTIRVLSRRRR